MAFWRKNKKKDGTASAYEEYQKEALKDVLNSFEVLKVKKFTKALKVAHNELNLSQVKSLIKEVTDEYGLIDVSDDKFLNTAEVITNMAYATKALKAAQSVVLDDDDLQDLRDLQMISDDDLLAELEELEKLDDIATRK